MIPLDYTLKRSGRRRTVGLHVNPDGEVRVLAPLFAPTFWIERVVKTHWPWVERKRAQFAATRAKYPPRAFVAGDTFPVWGRDVPLDVQIVPHARKSECILVDQTLRITLSPRAAASPRESTRKILLAWYFRETETRITERIAAHAQRVGVQWKTFKIANQKSRWGSCARRGDLRFNGRLSLFPMAALDYVIVHELAHIKEANHSRRFWTLVRHALPEFDTARRLLRHTTLHTLL